MAETYSSGFHGTLLPDLVCKECTAKISIKGTVCFLKLVESRHSRDSWIIKSEQGTHRWSHAHYKTAPLRSISPCSKRAGKKTRSGMSTQKSFRRRHSPTNVGRSYGLPRVRRKHKHPTFRLEPLCSPCSVYDTAREAHKVFLKLVAVWKLPLTGMPCRRTVAQRTQHYTEPQAIQNEIHW